MNEANKTVRVQDKHTMKASARKARNNKVYTAKGQRDRRIRLSADTAIQFYDVQDRLGYERASEAVDWLINKSRGSIDKLFGTSLHQEFEQLTQQLDGQNGANYLAGSSVQNDYGVATRQNFTDNSIYFPCIQYANGSQDQYFTHSSSTLSSPCQEHSYHMSNSFQHIDEKGGEILRTDIFNPKLNLKHAEHQFMSNSMPYFLQPPTINHYYELSSVYQKPARNPTLDLCLPHNCTSTFSDN